MKWHGRILGYAYKTSSSEFPRLLWSIALAAYVAAAPILVARADTLAILDFEKDPSVQGTESPVLEDAVRDGMSSLFRVYDQPDWTVLNHAQTQELTPFLCEEVAGLRDSTIDGPIGQTDVDWVIVGRLGQSGADFILTLESFDLTNRVALGSVELTRASLETLHSIASLCPAIADLVGERNRVAWDEGYAARKARMKRQADVFLEHHLASQGIVKLHDYRGIRPTQAEMREQFGDAVRSLCASARSRSAERGQILSVDTVHAVSRDDARADQEGMGPVVRMTGEEATPQAHETGESRRSGADNEE